MVGEHLRQFVNIHLLALMLFQQALVVVLDVDQRTVGHGNHAGSRVAVNGTERRVNAAHENVSLDVSDLITEVGTYTVTVNAVQPSGNYTNSEKINRK